MGNERVDLGFGDDALEGFDPNEWNPDPAKTSNDRPKTEETKQAAKAAGFESREVKPDKPKANKKKEVRRRRTGRDKQFNLKAKEETIQAYYDIADANNWGLGETLEKAVELLKKEYKAG